MGSLRRKVPVWPEPKQLKSDLLPVEEFDQELLPTPFRDFVADTSFRMDSSPLDYIGIAVMVAAASLIGGKVHIKPKENDNWRVVPNLWGMVIGRPSAKKTPALKEACAAIEALDRVSAEDFQREVKKYVNDSEFYKIEKSEAKKSSQGQLEKNREKAKEAYFKACENEPAPPVRHRRFTNDTTTEKLGEILRDNPSGILIFRDELTGWLRGLDKSGREQDRAFFLESWSGLSSFTVDRVSRGTIEVPKLTVSILGGIQPDKLKSYLLSRQAGEGDDGLLERFQLMTYPDHKLLRRIDKLPDQAAIDRACEAFNRLDNLSHDGAVVRFAAEAQILYNRWYDENLNKIEHCGDVHMESLLGKYPSLVASLALIIHLCESDLHTPIGLNAITRACGWAEYLESHARRVNALINHPAIRAESLVGHLRDLSSPFTPREVQQKQWKGLTTSEDIQVALELLCQQNYIRLRRHENTGGRPSNKYEINPRLL